MGFFSFKASKKNRTTGLVGTFTGLSMVLESLRSIYRNGADFYSLVILLGACAIFLLGVALVFLTRNISKVKSDDF